jgi:hypothetical protein
MKECNDELHDREGHGEYCKNSMSPEERGNGNDDDKKDKKDH